MGASLLNQSRHRTLIDAYGRLEGGLAEVAAAWTLWRCAREARAGKDWQHLQSRFVVPEGVQQLRSGIGTVAREQGDEEVTFFDPRALGRAGFLHGALEHLARS